MERREFIRLCAAAAAASPLCVDARTSSPRFYSRTRLLMEGGTALRASTLAAERNYVFHYPFEGTPCFLLNLGRPTRRKVALRTEDGTGYEWPGGVGAGSAIVAYSAICSHRLTYPTRQISFISYRDRSSASAVSSPNTIHCCSEHSQYDPAAGARVLKGPAPQPLAAIILEHDAQSDALYALGTLGGEVYNAFFEKYEMRLALEHGNDGGRRRVGAQTQVVELARYCKQQVRC